MKSLTELEQRRLNEVEFLNSLLNKRIFMKLSDATEFNGVLLIAYDSYNYFIQVENKIYCVKKNAVNYLYEV